MWGGRHMSVVLKVLPDLVRQPWVVRRAMVLASDLLICWIAVFVAYWLRLGELELFSHAPYVFLGIASCVWLAVAVYSGTYLQVIRFSGRHTVLKLIPTFVVMSVIIGIIFFLFPVPGVPRTLAILHPIVFFFGLATSRITIAQLIFMATTQRSPSSMQKRVLIYGAGNAGQQLARSMRAEPGLRLVGFVDQADGLRGRLLEGRCIWHSSDLDQVLVSEDITDVFVAMPSAPRAAKREIVEQLQKAAVAIKVRILPSLSEIAFDHVSVSDLRMVQVEELLGRDPVEPRHELLARDISGKRVLVTGAGGSIGSELCRQILRLGPTALVLADQAEHALYSIDTELRDLCDREGLDVQIIPRLADVSARQDCEVLFESTQAATVFHAAAYKHVPLVESNPLSGMRNNIFGTLYAAMYARQNGVQKFVLISTDKAVRPTNIMGASKRVCELIIQAFAALDNETTFTAVRFGNVLGSSGSVVPRFREQISRGGPITVTHQDVTRYFMTIPEAALLVIQAGGMAEGGEVFLLEMGAPVRIADLARTMIKLSGRTVRDASNPDGDIEIVETGLRPGEKLFEELLIDASATPTDHPRIVKARENMIDWGELDLALRSMEQCIRKLDVDCATAVLRKLVPGYSPKSETVRAKVFEEAA